MCIRDSLREDLECMNCASVSDMSTTAKLGREIAHLNHTDLLTILFAKQRHSAGLLRFIQTHLLCYNIQILLDLLIYQLLNLFDLLRSHGREMGKVKTESVRSYQGTGPVSYTHLIPAEHEKNVCGQFDGYLKKIERTLHVTIVARDGAIKLIGPELMIRRAKSVFNNLVELSKRGNAITCLLYTSRCV